MSRWAVLEGERLVRHGFSGGGGYSGTVCMNISIIGLLGFSLRRFRKTCMALHQSDRRHGNCEIKPKHDGNGRLSPMPQTTAPDRCRFVSYQNTKLVECHEGAAFCSICFDCAFSRSPRPVLNHK